MPFFCYTPLDIFFICFFDSFIRILKIENKKTIHLSNTLINKGFMHFKEPVNIQQSFHYSDNKIHSFLFLKNHFLAKVLIKVNNITIR